ncbi:MAG: hypothetical protein HY305_07165, partial [Sphingobacteriales bacterium]|nr:hypothetical protein [Sphingobacteriales bacterium]
MDPSKGGGDSKVLEALNIFGDKKIVENELLVLRSSVLIQEVIAELDLYGSVFNEGKVRKEELYGNNSPVKFIAVDKSNLSSNGKFYFKVDWKNEVIFINNKYVRFDSTVLLGNNLYKLEVNQFYSRNLIGKNYYVVFSGIEQAANVIASKLKAAPISNASTVIEAKLETETPEKAKDILIKLFDIYKRNGIAEKNQIAVKTLVFIDSRLRFITAQLDSVEHDIQSLKSKEAITDISNQGGFYLEKVKNADGAISQVDLQLDILNEIKNYIVSKGKKPGLVPSQLLVTDPVLGSLLKSLYDGEFELEKIKATSGERNENRILAQDRIDRLKSDILENMANIRTNLLTQRRVYETELNSNRLLLQQLPEKERALLEISRQQVIKNNIYVFLLQKREEAALSSATAVADLKIIENPSYYGPISPIAKNYYVTGLLVGIISAILLVLLKEGFNTKILFRDDIEGKMEIPFVGDVIQSPSKDNILINDGKRTVIAEQFRSIRTNLNFIGLSEQNKCMLVTSSISGEGKSFIAVNLAISLTLTGKRVVLLESDLRKPKLSKILSINREPGISNFLVGKADLKDIIKPTSINNLFLIPAGAIPP